MNPQSLTSGRFSYLLQFSLSFQFGVWTFSSPYSFTELRCTLLSLCTFPKNNLRLRSGLPSAPPVKVSLTLRCSTPHVSIWALMYISLQCIPFHHPTTYYYCYYKRLLNLLRGAIRGQHTASVQDPLAKINENESYCQMLILIERNKKYNSKE